MITPASFHKHPIHPMLVAFPIALWTFSLICDLVYHVGSQNTFWKGVAFYSIGVGIIGALLAAIPGFIDYLSLTDPRATKIASVHLALNLIVVVMFIFNLGIRYNALPSSGVFETVLSAIGLGVLGVSGWLGGALVYEHQVGVSIPSETGVAGPRRIEEEREKRAA
jgi:uncharacterized membrane protein